MEPMLFQFLVMCGAYSQQELLLLYRAATPTQIRYALVKLGGGVIQISGSIAGNTFARNRSGNYMRARTTPVNPNTQRQIDIRTIIADLSEAWHDDLSPAHRAAWNDYASAIAMTNKLGETIHITGFNHFIRSNSVRAYCGNPGQINAGPIVMSLPNTDPLFQVAPQNDQTVDITFDDNMDWVTENGAQMMVFCGSPQLASRSFYGGPYRYAVRMVGNAGDGPVSPLEGLSMPFTINVGCNMWWYARIQRADGRVTGKFYDGPRLVPA